MNKYEQAITAFDGAEPGTIHVTVDTFWKPPGTEWPYTAMMAPSMNSHIAIKKDPAIMTRRRGQLSMKRSAGIVITTFYRVERCQSTI